MNKLSSKIILTILVTLIYSCKKEEGNESTIDTSLKSEREIANDLYKNEYLGSALSTINWNGNLSSCNPGSLAQSVHDKVLKRVNYFRKVCGLPTNLTIDADQNAKCQEAALMFSANNSLSHTPPTSWKCYTTSGAEAAAKSNLTYGLHSVNAVTGQMEDEGVGNEPCGHRRWILYSRLNKIGHGSTNNTQALWLLYNISSSIPTNLPEFIAWPTKGYTPSQLVFPRWSFSVPGANFSSANVSMTNHSGGTVNLSVESRQDGYGDNSIIWRPVGIDLSNSGDVTYHVTISNVILNGVSKSYKYDVIIFKAQ